MARESVNIEDLTKIDANQLIQDLTQENSQLRLELMAQKGVINKLVAALQESDEETEE